jgi:hypothetical protein
MSDCHCCQEPEKTPESLWGEWCLWCSRDFISPESCLRCIDTYDKLKAHDKLPRRREAIEHTKNL